MLYMEKKLNNGWFLVTCLCYTVYQLFVNKLLRGNLRSVCGDLKYKNLPFIFAFLESYGNLK